MQSKKSSIYEVLLSTFIGLIIALSAQIVFFAQQGIEVTFIQNIYMSIFMTVVSVARSYIIRRWFNMRLAKQSNTFADNNVLKVSQ